MRSGHLAARWGIGLIKRHLKPFLKSLPRSFGYDLVPRPKLRASQISHEMQSWDKVFCIGANKTGTTTITQVLGDLGLRVAEQSYQERSLTRAFHMGCYSELIDFAAPWDAFQDQPFSAGQHYVACDALFPKAKFILTLRDADDWFSSLCRFHKRVFGVTSIDELDEAFFKTKGFYLDENLAYETTRRNCLVDYPEGPRPNWGQLYDPEFRKSQYINRNAAIRQHFEGRDDKLLVLDVTQETTTQRITRFLNFEDNMVRTMPHKNKTTGQKNDA